jgi:hypothetical protein
MENSLGPSWPSEYIAAGLIGAPLIVYTDGTILYGDGVTAAQKTTVEALIAAHDSTKPAPIPVPATVTRYQARAALLEAGLLGQVDSFFAALPDSDMGKLAWNEAPTVRRDSEALAAGAHALGLTDAQIDALFLRADEIQ